MREPGLADGDLIEAIARGDGDAFALLYARYSRRIAGFIYRRLELSDQRRGIVDDLVQETFLRVFTSAARFKPLEYKAPWWVYQQAKRALQGNLEHRTSMKRDAPTYSLTDLSAGRDGSSRGSDTPACIRDYRPLPDERLLTRERRQALTEAVAALPDKYRQVVELNLRDCKYPHIAVEVGLSLKETTARIVYGRELVKQAVREQLQM